MIIDSTQADTPAEGAVAATVSPQKLAILDVAQVLFTQQGYEGLSIRDLAQHCGLAKATIYHHFRDKEDLFLSVLERDLLCLRSKVVEAAAAETEPLAKLRAASRAYDQLLRQRRTGIMWNVHENSQLKEKVQHFLQERIQVVLEPWEDSLAAGVAAGLLRPLNARLCTLMLLSLVGTLAFYETHVAPLEGDPVEQALDLFINGIINGVTKNS
jgi:AcrR family transcriptional regulator